MPTDSPAVSAQETTGPTSDITSQPTRQSVSLPSSQPTRLPSSQPTSEPSSQPTSQPTSMPSLAVINVKAVESSNSGVLYGSLFAVLVSCSLLLFYCYRLRRKYDDDRLTAFVGSLLDEGDVSLIIGGKGKQ
jgi:PT repeat